MLFDSVLLFLKDLTDLNRFHHHFSLIVQKDITLETITVEYGIELTDETEYHEIDSDVPTRRCDVGQPLV